MKRTINNNTQSKAMHALKNYAEKLSKSNRFASKFERPRAISYGMIPNIDEELTIRLRNDIEISIYHSRDIGKLNSGKFVGIQVFGTCKVNTEDVLDVLHEISAKLFTNLKVAPADFGNIVYVPYRKAKHLIKHILKLDYLTILYALADAHLDWMEQEALKEKENA